jgi:ketosteroid isomerase-like protein
MHDRLAAAMEFWRAPRSGSRDLFADDVDVFFQGRSWPLGGHHRGREGVECLFEVVSRLWPQPSEIVETEFWANEDSVLTHWFTRNETWKRQACRNSGWAVWRFEGDRVVQSRNYVDTSFYAEVHEGWREAVGARLGEQLPNWPLPEGSRYPDPMAHE